MIVNTVFCSHKDTTKGRLRNCCVDKTRVVLGGNPAVEGLYIWPGEELETVLWVMDPWNILLSLQICRR